jgi:hypothetical protein
MTHSKLLLDNELYYETITKTLDKVYIVDEIYEILLQSYKNVKGGFLFASKDALIVNTDKWKVIYYAGEVVGVIIYKAKKGLKMVAMGIHSVIEKELKNFTKQALVKIFQLTFSQTWMEVSEGAEKFIRKNGGEKFLIPNSMAVKLTGKEILELCDDGYHYKRVINGVVKTKVMIGTAKCKI